MNNEIRKNFSKLFSIDLDVMACLPGSKADASSRIPLRFLNGIGRSSHRFKSTFLLVLILFLICAIPVLAQEKKVLIIGIDGLMPEAVGLPEMPNVNSLYQDGDGFLTYGYTEDLTFSGPSWSSILHGVHRDRHGVD